MSKRIQVSELRIWVSPTQKDYEKWGGEEESTCMLPFHISREELSNLNWPNGRSDIILLRMTHMKAATWHEKYTRNPEAYDDELKPHWERTASMGAERGLGTMVLGGGGGEMGCG